MRQQNNIQFYSFSACVYVCLCVTELIAFPTRLYIICVPTGSICIAQDLFYSRWVLVKSACLFGGQYVQPVVRSSSLVASLASYISVKSRTISVVVGGA